MPSDKAVHEILSLLAHINGELDGGLSLGALATFARRSPSELHRTFKKITGETTAKYVERVRIELAAASLVSTDATVLEVALAHGFQSHEVFTRAFRRRYAEAPSAFRRRLAETAADLGEAQANVAKLVAPCVGLYRLPLRPAPGATSKETTMPVTVTIETLNPQPALIVERTVKQAEVQPALAEILPKCFGYAMSSGAEMAGPPFTRYLTMSLGSMTIQAGVPVAGGATPHDDIQAIELPGGEAAVAIHVGPYDTLRETYEQMEAWAREQGREVVDAWETYLTDPGEVPDPAEWQTQIVMRLK